MAAVTIPPTICILMSSSIDASRLRSCDRRQGHAGGHGRDPETVPKPLWAGLRTGNPRDRHDGDDLPMCRCFPE